MAAKPKIAVSWFRAEDWSQWCAMDPLFDTTRERWLAKMEAQIQAIERRGIEVVTVEMDPSTFAAWGAEEREGARTDGPRGLRRLRRHAPREGELTWPNAPTQRSEAMAQRGELFGRARLPGHAPTAAGHGRAPFTSIMRTPVVLAAVTSKRTCSGGAIAVTARRLRASIAASATHRDQHTHPAASLSRGAR
jgi:hypothetical protein